MNYHESPGWSHSRLKAIEFCPYLWGLRVDTLPMLRGRLVHEMLERLGQHCMERGVEQDIAAGNEIATQMLAEHGPGLGGEYSFARYLLSVAAESIFPVGGRWGLEVALAVSGNGTLVALGDPLTWIRGKLDLLVFGQRGKDGVWHLQDDVATITDWKTDRCPPTWAEFQHGHDYRCQLDVYAYLVFCAYPDVGEVIMTNEYLAEGTFLSLRLEREKLDGVVERLRARVSAARKRLANHPAYNGQCSECAAAGVCRRVKLRPRSDRALRADPALILTEIERLDGRKKVLTQRLKEMAKETPVALGSGKFYGRKQTPKIEIADEDALRSALATRKLGRAFGRKVMRFVKPADLIEQLRTDFGTERAEEIVAELLAAEVLVPLHTTRWGVYEGGPNE